MQEAWQAGDVTGHVASLEQLLTDAAVLLPTAICAHCGTGKRHAHVCR